MRDARPEVDGLKEIERFRSPRWSAVAKQRIAPLSYLRVLAGGSANDEVNFHNLIAAQFGTDASVVPLGRARTGIYLLVKCAIRKNRTKVLMSPYTIPDVVTMVLLAGGEPVFFDFETDSTVCDINCFESLIDDRTACAIVTHYHVNEPRLRDLASVCRSRNAYLFDDCAISFGGSSDGMPLGLLTDASVFSFSSFKLLNFFWGGMVTTRNEEIARFIDEEMKIWPRLGRLDYLKTAKACLTYDLASSPVLFNTIAFPLIRWRAQRSGVALSLDNVRIETVGMNGTLTSRPALAAFAEWNSKLSGVEAWLLRRRSIARIYLRLLGPHMVSANHVTDALIEESCFVNFPVIVPEHRRDEVCRDMMLSGFDVGRSLYPNVHRHPNFSGFPGVSANVDKLVRSSIYLPTHFGVSESYAEEISAKLDACAF